MVNAPPIDKGQFDIEDFPVPPSPKKVKPALRITCMLGGAGARVTLTRRVTGVPRPGYQKRGHIKEFSRASRLRLLRFSAEIDWTLIPSSAWIRLSYPDDLIPTSPATRYYHLDLWKKRIERLQNKHVNGVWRVEFEARKSGKCIGEIAPHYHVILFGERYMSYTGCGKSWQEAIGATENNGSHVEIIGGAKGAQMYIAKYCAKLPCNGPANGAYHDVVSLGRQWGVIRRNEVPRHAPWEAQCITQDQWDYLRDALAALCPWVYADEVCGLTVLGDKAEKAKEIMWEMGLTGVPAPK